MSILKKQVNRSTEELLKALSSSAIKRTSLGRKVIKKLTNPKTKMPSSPTENFTYALCLAYCFFQKNHSVLMKHGDALKDYTEKYANLAPAEGASFAKKKFNKLVRK